MWKNVEEINKVVRSEEKKIVDMYLLHRVKSTTADKTNLLADYKPFKTRHNDNLLCSRYDDIIYSEDMFRNIHKATEEHMTF